MFSTLEDLDFANDIALLSSPHSHIQEKTKRLSHFASQDGFQLITNKIEQMRFNTQTQSNPEVDGKEILQINKFVYLKTAICTEDSTQKDNKTRLAKARTEFQ